MNMKRKSIAIAATCCLLGLTSCGTVNSAMSGHNKTTEFYRIFDVHTDADRQTVSDLASTGLSKWVSDVNERRPIPSQATAPEKAGRFQLKQVEMTGNMAALMAMSGSAVPSAVDCSGAVWIGHAVKSIAGTDGINVTTCLFQYQQGYHLDVYGVYAEKTGFTLNPYELGGKMARAVTGDAGEWMEKMIADTAKEIQQGTHAKIAFVEGYPKPKGQPWWSDK